MGLPFETDLYHNVISSWPTKGKVILGSYTPDKIILYQAYKPSIADWAIAHKTFLGCPDFSVRRMTWVKPNFLWMMFRSGWGTKSNQERILAISIKRQGFDEILRSAVQKTRLGKDRGEGDPQEVNNQHAEVDDDVRLQWDPDHDPYGEKVERRAIQLGLRGKILEKFLNLWIVDISDVTKFVQGQYQHVMDKNLDLLKIPSEKCYVIEDHDLRNSIGADQ